MAEIDKAEALKRIAEWMGWDAETVLFYRDPFQNLADAFALQAEIERRGLTAHFETKLWTALFEDCRPGDRVHRGMNWGVINASADQRTRAVLALIEQEASS